MDAEFKYQCENNPEIALMLMRTNAISIKADYKALKGDLPGFLRMEIEDRIDVATLALAEMVLAFEEVMLKKMLKEGKL